jgi:microcystin-dependent protein
VTDDYAYTGEIRLLCGDTLPQDWLPCDGRLLHTYEYETLFSLIFNAYGGDGINDYALPDLRGRVPVHRSATFTLGLRGGAERVLVEPDNLPAHAHSLQAGTGLGSQPTPEANTLAQTGTIALYTSATPTVPLAWATLAQTVGPGGRAHENMPPYLTIGMYMICVDGRIPSKPGED